MGVSISSVVHVLIAINSNEYNKKFISLISKIFPTNNLEIELHVCIMGQKPYALRPYLPKNMSTKIEIEGPAFNYSLVINTLLKQVVMDYPTAIVALVDGWTVISMSQIITKECEKIDWNNEFISVNTVFDTIDDPFPLEEKQLHAVCSGRVHSPSFIRSKPQSFSPIIIGKINHIVDLECGLEEELFSEYSRIHLSNQLKTAGLKQIVTKRNVGLCLRLRQKLNLVEDRDIDKISIMEKKLGYSIFIPSNYDVVWGDATKIGLMRIARKGLPMWKYPYKVKTARMLKIDDDGSNIKIDNVKEDTITEITIGNNELEIDKNYKVLIIVSSYVKDLISATPLIKEIYKKYGPPDILTTDKLIPANNLIRNFMVNKIYDLADFGSMSKFKEYGPNIIRTLGCPIRIPESIEVTVPLNVGDNLAEKNYSVIDPCINSIPDPYCHFDPMKRSVPPNTIAIAISTIITSKPNPIWGGLSTLCSKLANNTTTQILLLSLPTEKKRILTDLYKVRKNIHVFDNISYTVASGIINSSALFIAPYESSMSWIGWGLKQNSIILTVGESEIPDSKYMTKINMNKNKKNMMPIDDIINGIVDKI